MGNKICCEETRTQAHFESQNPAINKNSIAIKPSTTPTVSNQTETRREPVIQTVDIKVPQLSQKVADVLKTKKYFDYEQSKQTASSVKSYGGDIYVGALDEKGLKPNGFGKMYKQDNALYIGYFNHGKAEGKGAYIFADGSHYYGDFRNNRTESSKAEFISDTIHYIGGFSNNTFEGEGQEQGKDYKFKGGFHNGSRTRGLLTWHHKDKNYTYDGQFNEYNQFHGKGILIEPEGRYEGDFHNGEKHGKGTYYFEPKGSKYAGDYVHGIRQGYGTIYHGNGKIAYQGGMKNGLPHGKGTIYNKDNIPIEAEWVQGIDKSTLTP